MKLLIFGTPKTQEVRWIVEEAKKAAHTVDAISLYDVRIATKDNGIELASEKVKILDYEAYLFRGMTRHLWEALLLAEWLYSQGKVVVDERLATKRYIPSKASTSIALAKEGIPQPMTIIPMGVNEALQELKTIKYPVILKDAWGRQGRRVYLAKSFEEAKKYVHEFHEARQQYLIQEYIPVNYDTRVFVVGDKALGGMKRTAPENDFRSNLAVGGTAQAVELTPEMAKLAVSAAKVSCMEIAGVDILTNQSKNYVLEVNRCPQFKGFQPSTGINVAKEIVDYIASKVANTSKENGC